MLELLFLSHSVIIVFLTVYRTQGFYISVMLGLGILVMKYGAAIAREDCEVDPSVAVREDCEVEGKEEGKEMISLGIFFFSFLFFL